MHGRYVTDILKMCMKKFNAEKYFLTNLQGFDLHIAGLAANFLFVSDPVGNHKDRFSGDTAQIADRTLCDLHCTCSCGGYFVHALH